MFDHSALVSQGRSALLAGPVAIETAPADGQRRWGLSTVLRPDPVAARRLAELAHSANAAAGGGHWAHGPASLHITLRTLRERGPVIGTDPQIAAFREAITEAAAGTGTIRAAIRTVSPHPNGVAVHVHPETGALDRLAKRYAAALERFGLAGYEPFERENWYVNVLHFAAPVDVTTLVAWCDAHRDDEFGTAAFGTVELNSWRYTGSDVHIEPFSRYDLAAGPGHERV